MALYEFHEQDAYNFASHMKSKTRVRGDEMEFKVCPVCNGVGRDNEYKFSINLKTGQFFCMRSSCGAKGNMIDLSRLFDFSLGTIADEYYKPKKTYKTYSVPKEPITPKPPAVKYLESRGISQATAERYQITTKNGADNILVFPFIFDGEICMIKYRKTDYNKARDHAKEWSEKNGKPVLFGMSQCDTANKTLIVAEGQLDSLSIAEAGFANAVSVPNGKNAMTWVSHCWNWMKQFDTVIIFGDYEKGEISLLSNFARLLNRSSIKHVREQDYKDCKDANEILQKYGKEQIRTCINNSVPLPISQIKKMSSVKPVNLYAVEKLKTGIAEQDRLLRGGLPFGYVHIITGKSGRGKSTFASQIMIKAIEQKYPTLIYSGEMADYAVQGAMHYQIAGRKNIVENKGVDGSVVRFVTRPNEEKIIAWYDPYLYLYDISMLRDEREDLLNTVEQAIKQYGIRVVLIDNLMVAINLDGQKSSDKYERQSKFVDRFASMAQRLNVMIILVAHRRKGTGSENLIDEISGSSDIINQAGVVMSYETFSASEIQKGIATAEDRKLITIKNRALGYINETGYTLHYDDVSRRIYGDKDDIDYVFDWNESFEQIDDSDNPFD